MGLKPINVISSSDIRLNILSIISGVSFSDTCAESDLPSSEFSASFQIANKVASPSFFILIGCVYPQPSSDDSPQLLIAFAISNTNSHLSDGDISKACLYFSLLNKSLPHLKQQQRIILIIVVKY